MFRGTQVSEGLWGPYNSHIAYFWMQGHLLSLPAREATKIMVTEVCLTYCLPSVVKPQG